MAACLCALAACAGPAAKGVQVPGDVAQPDVAVSLDAIEDAAPGTDAALDVEQADSLVEIAAPDAFAVDADADVADAALDAGQADVAPTDAPDAALADVAPADAALTDAAVADAAAPDAAADAAAVDAADASAPDAGPAPLPWYARLAAATAGGSAQSASYKLSFALAPGAVAPVQAKSAGFKLQGGVFAAGGGVP